MGGVAVNGKARHGNHYRIEPPRATLSRILGIYFGNLLREDGLDRSATRKEATRIILHRIGLYTTPEDSRRIKRIVGSDTLEESTLKRVAAFAHRISFPDFNGNVLPTFLRLSAGNSGIVDDFLFPPPKIANYSISVSNNAGLSISADVPNGSYQLYNLIANYYGDLAKLVLNREEISREEISEIRDNLLRARLKTGKSMRELAAKITMSGSPPEQLNFVFGPMHLNNETFTRRPLGFRSQG